MNTTEFLTISSLIVPDRPAIIFEDKRLSYEELQNRVNRLANALAELGVEAGDRIAMLQVNTNEHVEVYFAAAKLDAVYVPLNFRARGDELTYMINDSEPKVLLLGSRYEDLVRSFASDLKTVQQYITLEGFGGRLATAMKDLIASALGRRAIPGGRRRRPDYPDVHCRHDGFP